MKNPNELIEALEEFFSPEVLKKLNRELNNIYSDRKEAIKKNSPRPSFTGKFDEPLYGRFSSWSFNPIKEELTIYPTPPLKVIFNSPALNDALWKLEKANPEGGHKIIHIEPEMIKTFRVIFEQWKW